MTEPAQIAEDVRPQRWSDCPGYDGVPEYGGPCWTCQGQPDHCPLTARTDGPGCG